MFVSRFDNDLLNYSQNKIGFTSAVGGVQSPDLLEQQFHLRREAAVLGEFRRNGPGLPLSSAGRARLARDHRGRGSRRLSGQRRQSAPARTSTTSAWVSGMHLQNRRVCCVLARPARPLCCAAGTFTVLGFAARRLARHPLIGRPHIGTAGIGRHLRRAPGHSRFRRLEEQSRKRRGAHPRRFVAARRQLRLSPAAGDRFRRACGRCPQSVAADYLEPGRRTPALRNPRRRARLRQRSLDGSAPDRGLSRRVRARCSGSRPVPARTATSGFPT